MKTQTQLIIESLEQLKVALPQDYSCGIEWSIAHIKEKFESNYTRVEVPKGATTAMQELLLGTIHNISQDEVERLIEKEKEQMKNAVLSVVTKDQRFRKLFEDQFEDYYNQTYNQTKNCAIFTSNGTSVLNCIYCGKTKSQHIL